MRNSLVLFVLGPLSACGGVLDIPNPFVWSSMEGARRVTLRCDSGSATEEGVDLATGEVLDSDAEVDLFCTRNRFLVLASTIAWGLEDAEEDGFCHVDPTHQDESRFERLEDVTADCPMSFLMCGALTDPYNPECAGVGVRVLDREAQSEYVLRVVSDDTVGWDNDGVFVLEYAPAP